MPEAKTAKSAKTGEVIHVLTMRDLQRQAITGESCVLNTSLLGPEHPAMAEQHDPQSRLPEGTQEILNLSDDLMLARTEISGVPRDAHGRQYSLDFAGWMFLHFRLDGESLERAPDGHVETIGSQSFILSASTDSLEHSRELLGDRWRTVGIACRPSFLQREIVSQGDALPDELERFKSGDPAASIWFAGEMTPEMAQVATTLLHPTVHQSVKPVYLRAKTIELMCLALDRVRQPQPISPTLRLSQYDIHCLQQARQLLDESRKPPSLQLLARKVGLNRNKLASGFKHVFGHTVGEYHRELRLQRAWTSLQNADVSIQRVADECGYRDAGSFTKVFKSRFGVLPSDVRPR